MKKIKTLFVRDWDNDPGVVKPVVEPELEFVIAGGAVPTRKWDGTCCMVKDGKLYKRHDRKRRKKGGMADDWKDEPAGWIPCEKDEKTGHWWGWALVDFDAPENWMHAEAMMNAIDAMNPEHGIIPGSLNTIFIPLDEGTYELCGPKVNGNPDNLESHVFIQHGKDDLDFSFAGGNPYDEVKAWFEGKDVEGIVWWKDGEPVAKIKKCDLGLPRVPGQAVVTKQRGAGEMEP